MHFVRRLKGFRLGKSCCSLANALHFPAPLALSCFKQIYSIMMAPANAYLWKHGLSQIGCISFHMVFLPVFRPCVDLVSVIGHTDCCLPPCILAPLGREHRANCHALSKKRICVNCISIPRNQEWCCTTIIKVCAPVPKYTSVSCQW